MIKTRNIINTESQEIFIGDNTSAYLLHLQEQGEDVSFFYRSVVCFYEAFVTKQLKTFDFKSKILPVYSCHFGSLQESEHAFHNFPPYPDVLTYMF